MSWEITLAGLVVGFLLTGVIKHGAKQRERERIIKLLEEELGEGDWVITLIKGSENVGNEIDNMSERKNK